MANISKLQQAQQIAAQNAEVKNDIVRLSNLLIEVDGLPDEIIEIINKYIE